jgi:hypothetical protein
MNEYPVPKRRATIVLALLSALALASILTGCGGAQAAVRQVIDEAETAAAASLNSRNLDIVEAYFATTAEGANEAGLNETLGALRRFRDTLSGSDTFQVHSFQIQSIAMHESGNLARVTYRLHFSLVRNGAAIFTAVVTQNLALMQTPRGWRISGGDTPQLSDVTGQWPPR